MNTTPNLIFLETLRLSLDCLKSGIDRATANSSPNTSHQLPATAYQPKHPSPRRERGVGGEGHRDTICQYT